MWVFSNTSLHLAGGSSWCCGIRLQLSGQWWQGLVAICLQMLCLSPLVTGPGPHKGSAVLGVVQVQVLVLVPSTGARGKTHKGWDWVQTTRQWTARAASSYHHQLDCYHHLLFFYLLFIPLSYSSSRKTMFCSPLPHYTLHAHPDICTRLSAGCRLHIMQSPAVESFHFWYRVSIQHSIYRVSTHYLKTYLQRMINMV